MTTVRATWLFGLALLLLAAPARATPCKHGCGEGEYRDSQIEVEADASSMALEPATPFGSRRHGVRVSVHGVPSELSNLSTAGLSKKENKRGKTEKANAKRNARSYPPVQPGTDDRSSSDSWERGVAPSRPEMPFQSAIPEPSAIVLFGVGLLVTAQAGRRRRRRA